MGEVAVSSEGAMESQVRETEMKTDAASSVVVWERFLPKLSVRVLLVESDDSTRQIIGALLRKCCYKVAAVSDGLEAWEVLKGRPHNIDLILTEVELPSISGYALLALIMEHDICKNIPVIMMSSNDSVSTVYKCMLRGAADFLVKPLRKNELRNLWQHVWRKQASTAAGPGPPDDSVTQQKIEATAENNAISNHSSGYMACVQRNRECIEKGSDAQSSCTKPEMEAEGAKCHSDDLNVYTMEECHQESRKTRAHDNEVAVGEAMASVDADYGTTRQDKNSESNFLAENSCREAIDLIGAFDKYLKGNFGTPASNAGTNKLDNFALLDLSLKRSHHPSGSVNQVNDETRRLNHSDASAFSRYINKTFHPLNSTSVSTCNQQKDHETNSEKQQSNYIPDYNSDTRGPKIRLSEATFSYAAQKREISHPIPVRGVRFENVINGFGSSTPQIYSLPQSGVSPSPSPGAAHHSQSFTQSNNFYPSDRHITHQRIGINAFDQTDGIQGQKLENVEDNGHHQSTGCGRNTGKISSVSVVVKTVSECGSEEGFHGKEGSGSHRSSQREAALMKFRLKRKERCFEKKVRYESRKKLAEQRPRVKGQFVRQATNDPLPESSSPGN